MRRSLRLHDASKQVGVPIETLVAMNPAFLPRIISGRSSIPRGYRLRVPARAEDARLARSQEDHRRKARGEPLFVFHEVRRGQTLGGIARKYGTTIAALKNWNGIRRPRSLQVGRVLRVPAG